MMAAVGLSYNDSPTILQQPLQTRDLRGWTRILIGLVSPAGAFDRLSHRG